MTQKRSKYSTYFQVLDTGYLKCLIEDCASPKREEITRQLDGGTNTMRNHLRSHHKEHFDK
uniref:BED-type domain-containing protein n=1 Tax=Steinernema glaseri TaxID=37863 RepID=A0A1I7Z4A9_9BILA